MLFFKPAFIPLALAVNMAMAASTSYVRRAQYADKKDIVCDSPTSHCVYLDNAISYGAADGAEIRCAKVDSNGFGYGVCQFPYGASLSVGCISSHDSGVSIAFDNGDYGSQYSLWGKNVRAIWSSEKRKTHKTFGKHTISKSGGDDLYVTCEK